MLIFPNLLFYVLVSYYFIYTMISDGGAVRNIICIF